jgi:cytoskeletal protein CcmA (bactofilin family)
MKQGSRANIGRTTKVTGRLQGDGELVVEGRVEGEVTITGHLVVANGGAVVAPVSAADVTIEGGDEGDVSASGAVVVRAGGTLIGAINAGAGVAIEDGARFSGRIDMNVELPSELQAAAAPQASARR